MLKNSLELDIELDFLFKYYTFDIAIPKIQFCIEVDGDFWHANEKKGYKVLYASQRKNVINDKRKNTFISNRGWHLMRIWVSKIEENLQETIKEIEDIICERMKLFHLNITDKTMPMT